MEGQSPPEPSELGPEAQGACSRGPCSPIAQDWAAVGGDIKSALASNVSFALEWLNDPGQAL